MYNKSYQWYYMWFGKIATQEFHYWDHYPENTLCDEKWEYVKDNSGNWWYFYNALHNPTSANEKIVDLNYCWTGILTDQMWAFIM